MTIEIDALQHLLRQWARWNESYRPKLGYPNRVPFIDLMKPSLIHDGDGGHEGINLWAMRVLDASIESLPPILCKAIYARYLWHRNISMADQAEERLAVIVTRKGLLLI